MMKTIILKNQRSDTRNQRSVLIFFALCGFALSPLAQAAPQVVPAPDGCYPGFTTAEGCNALQSLTTGAGNTGVGWRSLFSNTDGSYNTGVGAGTLILNNGTSNTAVGAVALLLNSTGSNNTAVGTDALVNSNGDYNTALGASAGTDPDIGSNNIYIGDAGFAGDTDTIAIGGIAASGTDYTACFIGGISGASVSMDAATVYIDTDGHLGTVLADAKGNPSAAPLRRGKGAQHQVMLNRKVEKLQATAAQQQKQISHQEKQISQQQRQIEVLMAQLKEQAAQIQKVSAQLEMGKPATKVVSNKP
jgi:hypothetical protein